MARPCRFGNDLPQEVQFLLASRRKRCIIISSEKAPSAETPFRIFSLLRIKDRSVQISLRRLALPSVSVPLACLTIALLAPAPARGGCDYPTHIERTPMNSSSGKAAGAKSHPRLPSKPCPCKGPHCSRQPLAPPAPSSVDSVTVPEWARMTNGLCLLAPQGESRIGGAPIAEPSRHPSVIYHPPRLCR